jgi:hypothetical protein
MISMVAAAAIQIPTDPTTDFALLVGGGGRHKAAELFVGQQHPSFGDRREPNLRCASLKGKPAVAELIRDHQAELVASPAIERVTRHFATIIRQSTFDGPRIDLPSLPNVPG